MGGCDAPHVRALAIIMAASMADEKEGNKGNWREKRRRRKGRRRCQDLEVKLQLDADYLPLSCHSARLGLRSYCLLSLNLELRPYSLKTFASN